MTVRQESVLGDTKRTGSIPLDTRALVTRGLKWQVVNLLGRQLLVFAIFTSLTRLLEPSAFGLVALVGVYLAFVALFSEQGVGTALVLRSPLEPGHLDTAFWLSVAIAILLITCTAAAAAPIAARLGDPRAAPLLVWSSFGLLLTSLSTVPNSLLVKDLLFKPLAIRVLLANLIGGVVAVSLAFRGYGVWALVAQQLAIALTGALYLLGVSGYRPSTNVSARYIRDILNVGGSVFASSVLWFVSSRVDQLFIGAYLGPSMVGLYVVGGRLPELARALVQQTVSEVSLPALSRFQSDHVQLRHAITRGMEMNALVTFPVFAGIASVSADLVVVLFGPKWVSAGPICGLLAINALLTSLQVFFHPALLASGGVGRYVVLNAAHASGVIAACALGVVFGLPQLVLALILNNAVIASAALLFLQRRIGMSPVDYLRPCVLPMLGACVMTVAVVFAGYWVSDLPATAALLLKVTVGVLSYGIFVLICGRAVLVNFLSMLWGSLGQTQSQGSEREA